LKRKNGECAACLKNLVCIFIEKIYKKGFLEGSSASILYIGRTVPKGIIGNIKLEEISADYYRNKRKFVDLFVVPETKSKPMYEGRVNCNKQPGAERVTMVTDLTTTFFKIVTLLGVFSRQVPQLLKSCRFRLAPQNLTHLLQQSFCSLEL
jgi:hypothetical protein